MDTRQLSSKSVTPIAICLFVALSGLYYAISSLNGIRASNGYIFWAPHLALDEHVPFVSQWTWAYLSYFPFCISLAILVRFTPRKLVVYASAFVAQYLVGGLFFLTMPSRIVPPIPVGTSPADKILSGLQELDGGFNIFPSMHVANVVLVIACLWVEQSRWKWIYLAWGCSIIVSTVLVKRHYILDIPGGVLLGIAAGYGVYSALRPGTIRQDVEARHANGLKPSQEGWL